MLNLQTIFALCLALATTTNGQVLQGGSCPQYKLAENFDPVAYFTGKWYEQKRFWNFFETGTKCVHAEYSLNDDKTVRVENSGFSLSESGRFSQVGEAYCDDKPASSCHVRFYPGTPYGKYLVLGADPKEYGLIFSCSQVVPGILNTQYAWILTREKNVTSEDMNKYLNVFKSNGIDTTIFEDIDQDCNDH